MRCGGLRPHLTSPGAGKATLMKPIESSLFTARLGVLPAILLIVMIVADGFQLSAFPALAELTPGLVRWKLYLLSLQMILSFGLAIVCPVVLLVLFFRRAPRFPTLFVGWAVAYCVFSLFNHFAIIVIFGDMLGISWEHRLNAEALRSLFIAVAPVAAFIPYILTSRRVQNTFVNQPPAASRGLQ